MNFRQRGREAIDRTHTVAHLVYFASVAVYGHGLYAASAGFCFFLGVGAWALRDKQGGGH